MRYVDVVSYIMYIFMKYRLGDLKEGTTCMKPLDNHNHYMASEDDIDESVMSLSSHVLKPSDNSCNATLASKGLDHTIRKS
jgi:hypothetical protein